MSNILIFIGVLAMLWPIIPLSHHTKGLPATIKFSPIIVMILGLALVWGHLSPQLPVIPSAKVELTEVHKGRAVVNLTLMQARSCKLLGMSVYFKEVDGRMHEGIVNLIKQPSRTVSGPEGLSSYPKTIAVSVDGADAKSMVFRTSHLCALGVEVGSEFGETTLPPEFN